MLYINPLDSNYARGLDVGAANGREKLAYRELEHSFLKHLMDEMTKTVPEDALFRGGPEKDFQQEMMNDSLSGIMADSGQLGIAKQMMQQRMSAIFQKSNPLQTISDFSANSALMRLNAKV